MILLPAIESTLQSSASDVGLSPRNRSRIFEGASAPSNATAYLHDHLALIVVIFFLVILTATATGHG